MSNYNRKRETFALEIEGRKALFEINGLYLRAEKSVVCRYGDTTVLTTLCLRDIDEDIDFVRLAVSVDEKFYSIGKIPSGFNKRESRPSYNAIVIARMVDRSLRSCFSIRDKKEIQITNTILSVDDSHDLRLAIFWNSFIVSLLSENLTFNKLISLVVIAESNGELVCNPSNEQIKNSSFELIMSASKEKILMLEMFSNALDEKKVQSIVDFAFDRIKNTIDESFSLFLNENLLLKKSELSALIDAKSKIDLSCDKNLSDEINEFFFENFSIDQNWDERKKKIEFFPKILLKNHPTFTAFEIEEFWYKSLKNFVSSRVLSQNKRVDDRTACQIRDLNISIDYLPGVHGSALFSRGNTNVISVLTFGKNNEKQLVDDALSRDSYQKHFFHHYNFPDFAVNSISNSFKSTSRREVGHGQLVEKTLSRLIPAIDDFPYTTRIVSEVISSEGSSSQASICASSLAMMSSGFPLKKHVAGISLGLFNDVVVVDINDLEDKLSEIDFKISGTEDGICSFQMDVKNDGINLDVFSRCLKTASFARLTIIDKMNLVIAEPRKNLSKQIVKCKKIYFGTDKIGLIIGQNGRTISSITSKTGSKIDFQNDGFVFVYHHDEEKIADAHEMMREIVARKSRVKY
jgi:polyribonucleotide nucleotidyltransferase